VTDTPTYDGPALVELLGHRRVAGHVTEVVLAGVGMLRVDVPATKGHPASTHLYAPSALYGLHPVDEATMHACAWRWRHEPVQRWELPALERDDEAARAWAEEGMAMAADPDPDYGKDLDDEDDDLDDPDDEPDVAPF
jgi:hypothetical protein